MKLLRTRKPAAKPLTDQAPPPSPARKDEAVPAPTPPTSRLPVPTELVKVTIYRTFHNAKSVQVAGTFNGWKPAPAEMQDCWCDMWRMTLALKPGRYEYRFVVDGKWTDDPVVEHRIPNPYGGHNTELIVEAPNRAKSETTKIPVGPARN